MRPISILVSVFALVTSTCAFAQNDAKTPPSTSQQGTAASRAVPTGSSAAGANSASGGTLMQQREKGMSPEAASGSDAGGKATGKIKQ